MLAMGILGSNLFCLTVSTPREALR
jgi:Ca2+-binding EF-hand superfamily protein